MSQDEPDINLHGTIRDAGTVASFGMLRLKGLI